MCAVCNIFRVNQSEYLSFNVNLAFSRLATTKISQTAACSVQLSLLYPLLSVRPPPSQNSFGLTS